MLILINVKQRGFKRCFLKNFKPVVLTVLCSVKANVYHEETTIAKSNILTIFQDKVKRHGELW